MKLSLKKCHLSLVMIQFLNTLHFTQCTWHSSVFRFKVTCLFKTYLSLIEYRPCDFVTVCKFQCRHQTLLSTLISSKRIQKLPTHI